MFHLNFKEVVTVDLTKVKLYGKSGIIWKMLLSKAIQSTLLELAVYYVP